MVFVALLLACGTETQIAEPIPAGATMVAPQDAEPLVFIPAGEFKMGTVNHITEEPVHTVELEAFWIDRTEVTNAMYQSCVEIGMCKAPSRSSSYTRTQYFGNPLYADYPVIYVTWNDANAYCTWTRRRLPTEAEWEKSARGTDARIYPWGNQLASRELLNFHFYVGDTSKVGSFGLGASPYGVQDMAGNVWEWVADWYDSIYYSISPETDPDGPVSGTDRVVRGGAWLDYAFSVRSALRLFYKPDTAHFNLGFRCAASAH